MILGWSKYSRVAVIKDLFHNIQALFDCHSMSNRSVVNGRVMTSRRIMRHKYLSIVLGLAVVPLGQQIGIISRIWGREAVRVMIPCDALVTRKPRSSAAPIVPPLSFSGLYPFFCLSLSLLFFRCPSIHQRTSQRNEMSTKTPILPLGNNPSSIIPSSHNIGNLIQVLNDTNFQVENWLEATLSYQAFTSPPFPS